MSKLSVLASILSIACVVLAFPERDIPNVGPEYLDMLLDTDQHELFSKLMGIQNVNLVRPYEGERTERPIFHKELRMGDILPLIPGADDEEEESRQMIKMEVYQGSKWPGNVIPYAISTKYSNSDTEKIKSYIGHWNGKVKCMQLIPRTYENDYIMIFPGSGCYSSLGRVGGQQALSLDVNGCVYRGTLLHEVEHAIGITHEQNRQDRDTYIRMNWGNIPADWRSQYYKNNNNDYRDQISYDYMSIMHYPVAAPETNLDAFQVRKRGVDRKKIGNGDDFTETDLAKISALYCN